MLHLHPLAGTLPQLLFVSVFGWCCLECCNLSVLIDIDFVVVG